MPPSTRSQKAPAPGSETKKRRGRPRKSVDNETEKAHNETNSPQHSNKPTTTRSVARRQTRSQHIPSTNDEVGSLTRKRKKPKEAGEAQNTITKRQRSSSQQEQPPEPEEDEEESAPREAFFDQINKSILPEKTRAETQQRRSTQNKDDRTTKPHDQEDTRNDEQPAGDSTANDHGNEQNIVVQLGPSHQSRRRKNKQKKKVSYGETTIRRVEEAAAEPGTNPSPSRNPKSKPKGKSASRKPKGDSATDLYDPENIVDDDRQQTMASSSENLDRESASPELGEPRSSREPDNSVMVAVEDSLFIEYAEEEVPTIIKVKGKWLHDMTSLMKRSGWTGNLKWMSEFVLQEGQTKSNWLKDHEASLNPKRCRDLFTLLHHQLEFCQGMPKAPRWEDQAVYLRENTETLQKSINGINNFVRHLYDKIEGWAGIPPEERDPDYRWGHKAMESLWEKLVPMLVLLLEESFKAGGVIRDSDDNDLSIPDESLFTSSTLDLPIRIVGWLKRLQNIVDKELMMRYPGFESTGLNGLKVNDRRRKKLAQHIAEAQHALKGALDQLDYIAAAPQRERETKEKDEAMLRTRQQEQQKIRDAHERQMRLFVQSLHRMSQTVRGVPQQSAADEYLEKHGGWYRHEDERLLDMIRKVEKPNARALTPLVPGREEEEVIERVRQLRERMRIKYENAGMIPPLWCYERR